MALRPTDFKSVASSCSATRPASADVSEGPMRSLPMQLLQGRCADTSKGSPVMPETTTRNVQIIRTEDPRNSEPHANALAREVVTPVEQFYVRNHGTVPACDDRFELNVNGSVRSPLRLTLSQIKKRFPKTTVMAALQCAGNRRQEMAALAPISGEVPWSSQAIGNALWSGARLRDVLEAAGVGSEARHVAFLGADVIEKEGKRIGFGASVALEKAMAADTLLAYEMNGAPLEPVHGYPLRGIIPGYIGARSVKWLSEITLQREPSDNFYQARSYKIFPPGITAATAEWSRTPALDSVEINAVICAPDAGASLESGPARICGYAIGRGGAALERVEVSVDDGKTWRAADLIGRREPWRWNLWEVRADLPRGRHVIAARARDVDGNEQPSRGEEIWNFKGYGYNAWHRLEVTAT